MYDVDDDDDDVCLSVRLSVCPQAYLQNYTSDPIFTKFFVHVCGSVLLWQRYFRFYGCRYICT